MKYDNTFSIHRYFNTNFDLGYAPQKYKFGKKPILVLILFWWIILPIFIIKTVISNKKIKEWNEAYEYRRSNWWKEYEKHLAKTIKDFNIQKAALKKLGLVEDDPDLKTVAPITLQGPKFDGYWRQAVNGRYRTSKYELTYIVFKKEQVLLYIANIDLLDPNKKKESTLEFFYSDITSVSTTTVSTKPKQKDAEGHEVQEIDTEAFVLIVPGDKISLAFTPYDGFDESCINGMKALIRERKRA